MTQSQQHSGIRSGIWINPEGSILRLHVNFKTVTGTYQTTLGSPDKTEIFDVTGFTDGKIIGFVALWDGHESLTSWTGRYSHDEHGEHIRTMWHLASNFKDAEKTKPTADWNFITTYSSQFHYKGPLTP